MQGEDAQSSKAVHGRIDALDGLRAIAVAAVVAYHLDAPWARGGYLGVSLFFTLSGYLITGLLLAEHASTGRLNLCAFYQRRMRRLAPASTAVLIGSALVLIIGGLWTASTRRDALSVLTYVANWRQVFGGHSYGAMFGPPSPFMHFWSLAVEEQFYLVLPIVTALCLRRSRRLFTIVIGSALAASALAGHVGNVGGRYFRTDVRALELLAGCALAIVCAAPVRMHRPLRLPRGAGVGALGAFVAMAVFVPVSSPMLHTLVLPATSVLGCILIVAVTTGGSTLRQLLSSRPMVQVGRLSYAIYLVHWPVVVFVHGTAARLAAIVVTTAALHVVVERPALQLSPRRAFAPAMAISGLTIIGVAIGQTAPAQAQASGFAGPHSVGTVRRPRVSQRTRLTTRRATASLVPVERCRHRPPITSARSWAPQRPQAPQRQIRPRRAPRRNCPRRRPRPHRCPHRCPRSSHCACSCSAIRRATSSPRRWRPCRGSTSSTLLVAVARSSTMTTCASSSPKGGSTATGSTSRTSTTPVIGGRTCRRCPLISMSSSSSPVRR